MPIVIRRKKRFRKHLLTIILLSVLAGIIGGGLVGISTSHPSQTQGTEDATS
jgi:hypothetical protein